MKPANNIPCCENIYGAADGFEASPLSGILATRSNLVSTSKESKSGAVSSPIAKHNHAQFPGHVLVSHCGIKIYRPLLSFPKSRLVATCKANGVPFVTDASNFDPKTTKRNAIRWLLSNDRLPMALRQESILRLGTASAKAEEIRRKKVIELLNATQLALLDLRSGRLIFTLL